MTEHFVMPNDKIEDQELIASLLGELRQCFLSFQDGIVNDDTFVGGTPLAYLTADASRDALTLDDSRQIKQALSESVHQSPKAFDFSLYSLVSWVHSLKGNGEEEGNNDEEESIPAIIGSNGLVRPLSEEVNLNTLIQARLEQQGPSGASAYWFSIKEALDKKKLEETNGDLSLIDADRRTLVAKRLNATPFERLAQEYSVAISSRFCDANGDLVSHDSLEGFVNQLVDLLLEKTKEYWAIAPLLSLFDAIVVPVLRPMLYPHVTWTSEHNFFSESGVFDVRQFANKRTSFETTPTWGNEALEQALHYVEDALKHRLALRYLGLRVFDAFSPYNREIHSANHVDPAEFKGKIKTFGPPVHATDVMQLIQPVAKKPEEKVLEKVMTYRSAEEGVWH